MRLEVDVGNTRMKWRLVGVDSGVVTGVAPTSSLICQDALSAAFSGLQPYISPSSVDSCCRESSYIKSVYIASVVPSGTASLEEWCSCIIGVEPLFAVVSAECAGVINGYDEISEMGVDRWLAILSAYPRLKSRADCCGCLVISVGSAMTVDILLSSGEHKGGYIVPGLHMMNNALFKGTGRVKVTDIDYPEDPIAGASTRQAVSSGLPLMLVGLIQRARDELLSYCSLDQFSCGLATGKAVIYIAGGDGEYIASLLRLYSVSNVYAVPDLVIDGLKVGIEGR